MSHPSPGDASERRTRVDAVEARLTDGASDLTHDERADLLTELIGLREQRGELAEALAAQRRLLEVTLRRRAETTAESSPGTGEAHRPAERLDFDRARLGAGVRGRQHRST